MIPFKWILSSVMMLLYACAVMYLLLDVRFKTLSNKRKLGGILFLFLLLAVNISAQMLLGYGLYGKFYLLFAQIPVYLLFRILSSYRGIKLLFALLTTVFFSSPIMIAFFAVKKIFMPSFWLLPLCYLGFLALIYKFFKQPFNYMLQFAENKIVWLFTAIPLLYYIYNYALTQYQLADIVMNRAYLIRQLPQLIVLVAYLLLVMIFKVVSEKAELTNAQNLAFAQLGAATKQIEQLREAEKSFAIYRHDFRHHLNYINSCITEYKLEEASAYIQQTVEAMDHMKLMQYSQNEPLNLILSAYVSKAKEKEITIKVSVSVHDFERFQMTDLCSLLANALENAINACVLLETEAERYIKLRMYEKNNKLCIDVRNSYAIEPVFEDTLPISSCEGHGIGVKSIVHVIEKYEGVYRFFAKDGTFTLQVSM